MELTEYLGLRKPGQEDFYNVEDFNHNVEILDVKLGDMDESVSNLQLEVRNIEVPVKSVNSKTGVVKLTASDVGAVPTTRKVNNRALSGDITLTKSDIGLSSVENYGIATTAEAQAGTANNKYMTPIRTKELVQYLAQTGGISMVKSIQRGVATGASTSGTNSTISIAAINPAKSFVLLDSSLSATSTVQTYQVTTPSLVSISSTSIVVSHTGKYNATGGGVQGVTFSWQVVEYY